MPKVRMPPERPKRTEAATNSRRRNTKKSRRYPTSPLPKKLPDLHRIAAIDPGITTGMAFRFDDKIITCVAFTDEEVLRLINKKIEYVVLERFQTGGRLSTYGLHTIELVGQIVGWCKALKIPFEVATPQARYAFMKEAQGAVGGLIEPSDYARHEIDALAHLLAFEYRNS